MNIISVEIKNKKAYRTNETTYVCDNSDFTVVFSFDEEWDEFDLKTARFAYNDKHQDVVFTGTECPMPIISNAKLISVGVFAGDLHTSTPAVIVANRSILGVDGVPEAPSEDIYAQIISMIEEIEVSGGGISENKVSEMISSNIDKTLTKEGYSADAKEVGLKLSKVTPVKGVDYWTSEDKEEITEYIDEQTEAIKSDVEGIQKQINEHAHFKGYKATNAEILEIEATPNDFAYSAESGTKWVYSDEIGWQDTGSPVPDQLTPASELTPLIDGEASVGESESYARGDHRHPTDTTRASVEEVNALKSDMERVLDELHNYAQILINGGVA